MMGEYLPDGTYQRDYSMYCWRCRATVAVNLMGRGTCDKCGAELPKLDLRDAQSAFFSLNPHERS